MEFILDEKFNNLRLDKAISLLQVEHSRSQIQTMIKEGFVFVNDIVRTKNNYKVQANDCIRIVIPTPVHVDIVPVDIPIDIVYEDKDVAVINKKSGMVVHPAPGHLNDTLVNALMFYFGELSTINGVFRPGIVHRIDKDTSGLLLVAKNDLAHQSLADQLRNKSVIRKYIALVHGVINHDFGKIDAPIGRDVNDRLKMCVTDKNSKEAITNFTVLERFKNSCLVECQLETGRTHQIRVHLSYIGFPIIGDPLYGRKNDDKEFGQYLHAKTIGFNQPSTNEYLEFTNEPPEKFMKLLIKLREE